jgi:hypothetical protein
MAERVQKPSTLRWARPSEATSLREIFNFLRQLSRTKWTASSRRAFFALGWFRTVD